MSYLKKLLPVLFLAGLLLIFFWPVLTGGTFISTGMIYSDLMAFNYPLKDWYKEFLSHQQMPFWTSLLGSGYPLFAEGQIGALYPPHLFLFRLFPTLLAFNLNLFLHFLGAAVFTFAFCRVSLKRSLPASLLSGLTYSFSGFNLTHLHQINIILVISYLPLLLLLIERLVTTRKYFWAILLAGVLALQILAGFMQLFYYTSLITTLFFILIAFLFPQEVTASAKRESLRLLFFLFLAFFLAAGITAVQLLPTWELTKFSQRAQGLSLEASSTVVWPLKALSLFINPRAYDIYLPTPDFHPLNPNSVNFNVIYGYIGVLPLIFVLLAIFRGLRTRYVTIFTIFLVGAFIFGMGSSTQFFTILWTVVPGMKFFREPVKILFLTEFCLAVLAAFGLDYFLEFLAKKKASLVNFLPKLAMILVLITFLDLYFNNARALQPVVPGDEWFQKPPVAAFLQDELKNSSFRYYSCGTGNLDYSLVKDFKIQKELQNTLVPNFNLLYKIPSSQEWVGLFLKPMLDLKEKGINIDLATRTLKVPSVVKKGFQLQNIRFIICNLPLEDEDFILRQTIPLSRPINQLAFLEGPQGVQRMTLPTQSTYIYEYRKAVPRALFVANTQVIADRLRVLERVLSNDFDPTKEVILEEGSEIKNQGWEADMAEVKMREDKENSLELAIKTKNPGFLVLADVFYPGWRAQVDGQPVKIYRANYAFRAVPVREGEHSVKFIFEPTHWRLGLGISGIALLATLLGLGYAAIITK